MPYSYEKGSYYHQFEGLQNSGSDIYINNNISVDIERNLLTMATSRSGKGVAQIIPNLLRWKHSALVIDPKGEAAEATAEAREAMGQAVHVLDPFETCNVDERFRARLNLLDEINPKSPNAFRQINAMADGLIMRHSPESGHWDGGAQEVLAGFLAYTISDDNTDTRNLVTMRHLLTEPDPEKFGEYVDDMANNESCGRLPMTGAGKLTKTGTEAGHFLSGAVSNTKWIDDPFMQNCLSDSTFKLSDLKNKLTTIYLVLPFDALSDYGRFLRLFVRMALYQMQQKMPNGSLKGERCLFILDEFYSLGNISEISKSVGGMPGYNLHLWPFLQDHNQLNELYGRDGAGTFFANSDYSFFYGVNDIDTASFVSKECGLITESDLGVSPPNKPRHEEPQEWTDEVFTEMRGVWPFNKEHKYRKRTEEHKIWYAANHPPSNNTPSLEKDAAVDALMASATATTQRDHQIALARWNDMKSVKEAEYQDAMNTYGHAKATVGHARIQPIQIMEMTTRTPKNKIAETAICLTGGKAYTFAPKPFFIGKMPNITKKRATKKPPADNNKKVRKGTTPSKPKKAPISTRGKIMNILVTDPDHPKWKGKPPFEAAFIRRTWPNLFK